LTGRYNEKVQQRQYTQQPVGGAGEGSMDESDHPDLPVRRLSHRLVPDERRVVLQPWLPGRMSVATGPHRFPALVERIMDIPPSEVSTLLADIRKRFADRHRDIEVVFAKSFDDVARHFRGEVALTDEQRLLIGAYCSREFAIEAAALTNPSIVPAPDQSGLRPGELRFVLSLRSIGEGHISSIEFRIGVVDRDGNITVDEPAAFATTGERTAPAYDKEMFLQKLGELGADLDIARRVIGPLADGFSLDQLEEAINGQLFTYPSPAVAFETIKMIHWLASSNYVVRFSPEIPLSERVIFPAGPNESEGMEDARFVRLVEDDGRATYYATYTAYDGFNILPQLIETSDFATFRIATLNGQHAQHKGLALFPRLIDGRYAAISRHDQESLYFLTSENVRFWQEAESLQMPAEPWELVKIGNCGSPLETDAGWLVITHGVGPVRQYALGVMLLDLEDPRKVLGQLQRPLLAPDEEEREGYVPNVVYSCGALVHEGNLVVPYGYSDTGTKFAVVSLDDLLPHLV
jgi:predicted GH43/DUF377 family glycosyl hydrolase